MLAEIPELGRILILAVIQGLTEFLPISSDGHLVIASALMGPYAKTHDVVVLLHFGTLLSIIVYYRRAVWEVLSVRRRLILPLMVSCVPAFAAGYLLSMYCRSVLDDALLTGFMLVVTGFLLMAFVRVRGGQTPHTHVTITAALLIGVCQTAALLPGISRSCTTILAGLLFGLRRDAAATFSFLMGVPAIAGATAWQTVGWIRSPTPLPVWPMLLAEAVAFVVGLLAIQWLILWLHKGRIHTFAYWVMPLGFAVILWQLRELMARQLN
jgi:undecaprenyl-diphosphatase